ncbi:group-specific protein [Deep-sea thermophilic phage D6E]|uniref:Holliday junction resolvase n=1 Tax=Deep-sea thermophilic phage D6E TaxID=749413 RepID=UPI0001F38877|nr:Holliday junction resolvase [Deep-sea thermophilic phage D6E]ADE87531.1 group-specific protein [Deep-sea thermophilic phage D6E]
MSGRKSKRKGYEGERELVSLIPGAKRVPLSGSMGGEYGNDVILPNGWRVEVKRRKNGMKQLYDWLEQSNPDLRAFRADRKEWIICMTLDKLKELMGLRDT